MHRLCWALSCWIAMSAGAAADGDTLDGLRRQFDDQIVPLVKTHCQECHAGEFAEASLDLARFRRLQDVTESHRLWETILGRVEAGEMPPEDAAKPLSKEQRGNLTRWIQAVLRFEASRNADDPGPVLARRLSNAEYDYSIRDLTGVDIRPTKTFPVDPANEAGFDNSGESLTMSPALMNKYLEAARKVADHLVLTPRGIDFAPHSVTTDTDRDKYCVNRIVEFYQRQPTDYADYFFAAWSYRHRKPLGNPETTLQQVAEQHAVSAKYLATVWGALTEAAVEFGPLAKLQKMWSALPEAPQRSEARTACERMRDYVTEARKPFQPSFDNLHIEGVHKGSQPFVLWKNRQYAAHRRKADFAFLEQAKHKEDRSNAEFAVEPPTGADQQRFRADCEKFCETFPDAFYISERGRDYLGKPKAEQEKGRLLSAGFHSMMGYFRDDTPLYEMILDDQGQRKLDSLWRQLHFVTADPLRQYQGFLWFERTDSRFMRDPKFDFARPEDKASLTEPMIERLADVYVAKAEANGGEEVPLQAIRDYFENINQQIRWVEQARIAAQPHHVDQVIELAQRAYRRPLRSTEEQQLREYYQQLLSDDELEHSEAIQDMVVAVLMSPRFCYRVDLLSDSDETRPLDDFELASRLSYFLWSSIPDAELLQHAEAGDLHDPDVLLQQTRRMLRDRRVRGLAVEFGANWLDVRRFETHNSVDRERFPSFDDELRRAMFEEPIRFFVDVAQHDRSILDFLYADHTFVNAALAEHYGMPHGELSEGEWAKVTDARSHGRGGLLPMAVFLTKNAPGLRTSPVKRGYWVVRRLLGEHIPPPPPDVPDLPEDESQLGELTLKETLVKHRAHRSCAACHDRFDAIGIAFEGFGPIGERRKVDLGGRPIDTGATFPDGSQRTGVAELRGYLRQRRQADFVDNLCRKLLSYALGRTLRLSDETLLQKMRQQLLADEYRFGALVESIVTSPQFLNKRGRDSGDG